jgi:hypothetical protein
MRERVSEERRVVEVEIGVERLKVELKVEGMALR